MQPFNLDRFKAGEPAYNKNYNLEFFYLGELPDGSIAVKYLYLGKWFSYSWEIQFVKDVFYMKEKELTWKEVFNWANDKIEYRTPLSEWLDANFEPPKLKNK